MRKTNSLKEDVEYLLEFAHEDGFLECANSEETSTIIKRMRARLEKENKEKTNVRLSGVESDTALPE